MPYSLQFHKDALKEWKKLDSTVREQFKKALRKRLEEPHVQSAALSGMPSCYKIKLRSSGYRLVYKVDDGVVTVFVIAVGKREGLRVYDTASRRM